MGRGRYSLQNTRKKRETNRDLHPEEPLLVNLLLPTCKKRKWGRDMVTRGLELKESSKWVQSRPNHGSLYHKSTLLKVSSTVSLG